MRDGAGTYWGEIGEDVVAGQADHETGAGFTVAGGQGLLIGARRGDPRPDPTARPTCGIDECPPGTGPVISGRARTTKTGR